MTTPGSRRRYYENDSRAWLERATEYPSPMDEATLDYVPKIEVQRAGGSTRWNVQRNLHAPKSIGFQTHTVTWTSDSFSFFCPHSVGTPGYDTASGDGAGFVDALFAGDRVAVIARARVS